MLYSQFVKQDILKNNYILKGDGYLAKRCIDFFCQKLGVKQFDISIFDDENFDSNAVVSACEQLSFFAQKRLVIVKDLQRILEKDKKTLSNYIKNSNPLCTLLLVDTTSSGIFDFTFCDTVELKLSDSEMANFVSNKANSLGVKLDSDAISTLILYSNRDMTKLDVEIQKLCDYKGDKNVVTKEDVTNLVHADEEIGVIDLTNALGEKNVSKCLHILSRIMGSVDQNSKIFQLLSSQMRRMFFIACSKKSDSELANIFKIKEFAVKRLRAQTKNFSIKKLKDIVYELEDVEYMLKNAMFSQENALYYLVTFITN